MVVEAVFNAFGIAAMRRMRERMRRERMRMWIGLEPSEMTVHDAVRLLARWIKRGQGLSEKWIPFVGDRLRISGHG